MIKKVLIFGGAGFIGSNLARFYVDHKWDVTIVDGLLDKTGGRFENLTNILDSIKFIDKRIENIKNLSELIDNNDLVIDCMAWTSHRAALMDPFYDLELNVKSHIHLLNAVKEGFVKPIIYLGSRGQYGNPAVFEITEDTPMIPEDVQGINKLAAENYFRVYSRLKKLNIVSIRFPNCYGMNQPTSGDDIGLIGSFIRDILDDKEIVIYGNNRKRFILYVKDLCEYVYALGNNPYMGFNPYNISGVELTIEELVQTIVSIIGKGNYIKKDIPHEIKAIDIGTALFNDEKIQKKFSIQNTNIIASLKETVMYFQRSLSLN